jgi:putative nucleotidyltransferase with HDIG domain
MKEEKKRILFVDDDRNVLDGLRRMLYSMRQQWKMEFVMVASDALKVMAHTHYDVIVSDLRMPGMDGIDLLEKVREKYPDTIRFMLSGYAEQTTQGRAAKCVHQYISKPCNAEHLKNMVSRAVVLRDRLKSKKVTEIVSSLRSLPVMPDTYQEVIEMLGSECSSRQIGKIIARDIGMSSKILQVVNSAFYGRSSNIVDPIHAVVYLGLKTVEALVLTQGIFSKLPEKTAKRFFVSALQEHCVRVGMLARAICQSEEMTEEHLEAAAMAGILHEAGKMILITKFPDECEQAIATSRDQQIPIHEVERGMIGVTHAELGGCLLDMWGLPNTIIESAAFHHEPWLCNDNEFSIVSAVYAANVIDHQLCCGLGDGWFENVNGEYLEQLGIAGRWLRWKRMHLPIEIGEFEYVG